MLIYRQDTGRKKILKCMVAAIPPILTALNFFVNKISVVTVIPKYLNFDTFSKNLFAVSKLQFFLHLGGKIYSYT